MRGRRWRRRRFHHHVDEFFDHCDDDRVLDERHRWQLEHHHP
jgi:hypothetical protein